MAPFWKKLNSPQSFANHDFTSNFLELALLYDVLRNAKFTTVRKRMELPHDSLCKYDSDMVSAVTQSSIFLVHSDNVMEVKVALLKELMLVSSDHGTHNSLAGSASTSANTTELDTTEVVYLDTPKLEYAQTGKEPAQIRKVNDSSSVLCSPTGGLRHFASSNLTPEELDLILNEKAAEIDFNQLDGARKLAIGWVQRKQAKPLSKVTYSRNRFSYVNDDDAASVIGVNVNNSTETNIWATMDSNIKLEKTTKTELSSAKTFPHSILEIRWKGTSKPQWLSDIEKSHLVYPMREGFSLYAYSVVSFYSDQLQSVPSWLEIIEDNVEIRKVPSVAPVRRSMNSSANLAGANRTDKSVSISTPSILLNDSNAQIHDYDSAKEQEGLSRKSSMTVVEDRENRPQMLSRVSSFYNPASRQRHKLQSQPSESKLAVRYWNEFDDPEDGEDLGVFVINDEDPSGSYQDKLFSEANIDALVRISDKFLQSIGWFTSKITGSRDGYEALREGNYRRGSSSESDPDEEDEEEDDFDEEASVGRYSPRIKPRTSSDDSDDFAYRSFGDRNNSVAAQRRNSVLTFLYSMCLSLAAFIIMTLFSVTLLQDISEISLGTYVFMISGFIFALAISMLGLSLYLLCEAPPWWQQTIVFSSFFSIVCFGVGGIAWILT
ncbi:hypothetical protein AWJ20_1982 [Sugiyamaella lignohabitans]|uniref:VTC domain-containing protein n=1 Tax=Sugiyamaella lignohabitans TaxID=796027 RepID=A0A167ERR7_9ASCO|nr:uncharacterized protein AWJ20_1982 [Sugiyamaella lignohabitans]ANB14394.1 hypothetical protein AWJ20_1982 [Sugiyamaella lignohabitans]